ncbi:MAG TPA: cytochrome C biogenesis protein, partial [Bacteroidia bacterium]|nr:cytochrome C biogenesis protein [Bacteroidia bacterium]
MQKIHYIGEHLLIGRIGNVFVLLSFVGALLAALCYFLAEKNELERASWIKTARIAFRLHSLGVIGIVVTLFTMIFNHYYEYYYVWEHSNNIMPMRYVLSCFWEGQEGSFLLWTFWQVVLGNILIYTAKNWESSVMTVIALVQTFLASMLLGFYFHGIHIGSNPFTSLLRENSQFANIPLFQEPNYLQHLDGRGLNPLLQNYWMTIHPPTLFLG